jgi:hypothetical protein
MADRSPQDTESIPFSEARGTAGRFPVAARLRSEGRLWVTDAVPHMRGE